METPQVNRKQIDDLRAWFFAKDRSISLAQNCLYYLFVGGQANGAYMSTAFIAETVVSASVASVTLSNIPQDFRHLMIITQARTDAAAEVDVIQFRLNADAGANYDRQALTVNNATLTGAATRGALAASQLVATEGASSRAFNFGPGYSIIFGYSVGTQEKWGLGLSAHFGDVSADGDLNSRWFFNRWRNKNVVTSIVLVPATGPNFVSGSRFQLYGIL